MNLLLNFLEDGTPRNTYTWNMSSTTSDSKGHFDIQATPINFLRYHDPVEKFMSGDRNICCDLIYSHPEVVGWIYVEDGIFLKNFLPTKI